MSDIEVSLIETSSNDIEIVVTEDATREVVVEGIQGPPGPQGKSAYQVAVDNDFIGSQQDWLDSLIGNASDLVLTKTESEIVELTVDFSNRLEVGVSLQSVVSVSASPAGLVVTNPTIQGNQVVFQTSGGVALQGYRIDISVNASAAPNPRTGSVLLLITD